VYIAKLGSLVGLNLDFSKINEKQNLKASIQSMHGKIDLLVKIINESVI
jgi:hypothetical protein